MTTRRGIRKMTRLLVPAIACVGLAFAGTSAQAATLTEGVFHIIGSSNSPASNVEFKLSVFPGKEGFAGIGNVGSSAVTVDETFNNPIVDYRFFTPASTTTASTYAIGTGGLISDVTGQWEGVTGNGTPDFGKFWKTNDPGTGYTTTPDRDQDMMIGNVVSTDGSVDISALREGSLYFFYGGYRAWAYFDITMSDSDGPEADIVLTDVGDNDYANNNEVYVYTVDFLNDAGYDTITYHYDNNVGGDNNNGRFMGIVVTAPPTEPEGDIPEPITMALLGLAAAGLGGYVKRRRKS